MTDNDFLVIYLHHCSHHLQCRFIFLITVSLIWISHFDLNVTILYSCPHICLPLPPTQAGAEAVRESISGAFARGTIPSAASAGLLSHCRIARACCIPALLAHCPRMRMPRGTRMGASLASLHRPRMQHRPPTLTSARLIGKLGSPSPRADASLPLRRPRCPAARVRTPCH